MAQEDMISSLLIPENIPSSLITEKASGTTHFAIDKDYNANLKKVEGNPESEVASSAAREAYLAFIMAQNRDVDKVFLGKKAVNYVYNRAKRDGEKDVDAIGFLANGSVLLGDAKGQHFSHALGAQFPQVASVLQSKPKGPRVAGGIILAKLPETVAYGGPDPSKPNWKYVGSLAKNLAYDTDPLNDPDRPRDPKKVYLLCADSKLHPDPSAPPGFAVEPYRRFPTLETHFYIPHFAGAGAHFQRASWSSLHPCTIPFTRAAKIRVAFVR